jgi:DNA-binding response OmpR family regulator
MNETSRRILVLDDDLTLLRVIRLSLSLEGFEVSTAADGVEGLEHIEGSHFDLVVLDLQMPRMDGRSFFRALRQRGHEVPVLILSAYGAEEARLELNAEGAISKPFDPSDLVNNIWQLLPREGALQPAD